jgi:hypothetical protein
MTTTDALLSMQIEKGKAFRDLHGQESAFVIPRLRVRRIGSLKQRPQLHCLNRVLAIFCWWLLPREGRT